MWIPKIAFEMLSIQGILSLVTLTILEGHVISTLQGRGGPQRAPHLEGGGKNWTVKCLELGFATYKFAEPLWFYLTDIYIVPPRCPAQSQVLHKHDLISSSSSLWGTCYYYLHFHFKDEEIEMWGHWETCPRSQLLSSRARSLSQGVWLWSPCS